MKAATAQNQHIKMYFNDYYRTQYPARVAKISIEIANFV